MSQPQTNKNTSPKAQFWTVWLLVSLIAVGGAAFWGWKYWTMSAENERFEISIANTTERLASLQPGSAALNRRRTEVARKADSQRKSWSKIMTQVLKLETKSVRFAKVNIDKEEVTATVNAASWDSLESFVEELSGNTAVREVRVSAVNILNPAVAGASQEAQIKFSFTPTTE